MKDVFIHSSYFINSYYSLPVDIYVQLHLEDNIFTIILNCFVIDFIINLLIKKSSRRIKPEKVILKV